MNCFKLDTTLIFHFFWLNEGNLIKYLILNVRGIEHKTRQFPVVGGPRAFAQPNNFYHLLL